MNLNLLLFLLFLLLLYSEGSINVYNMVSIQAPLCVWTELSEGIEKNFFLQLHLV